MNQPQFVFYITLFMLGWDLKGLVKVVVTWAVLVAFVVAGVACQL